MKPLPDLAQPDPWFRVSRLDSGAYAIEEPLHAEHVISYLVVGSERSLLIDTGMGIGNIRRLVESLTDLPITVLNSHSHWDHIGGNWRFSDIAIHVAEADWLPKGCSHDELAEALAPHRFSGPVPPDVDLGSMSIKPSIPSMVLSGGETFDLGDRHVEVVHAPGHSPGGLVVLDRTKRVLYSTDVAYPGPLYAHGADTNLNDYECSLALLAKMAHVIDEVHPSHNAPTMSPNLLPAMAASMAAVMEGRAPDEVTGEFARHDFDGFAILAPPSDNSGRS